MKQYSRPNPTRPRLIIAAAIVALIVIIALIWLILTPQGYYAASTRDAIKWRPAGSSDPWKEVPSQYHDPQAVGKALPYPVGRSAFTYLGDFLYDAQDGHIL